MHLSRFSRYDKVELWSSAFDGKLLAEFDVRFFNKNFGIKLKRGHIVKVDLKPTLNGIALERKL